MFPDRSGHGLRELVVAVGDASAVVFGGRLGSQVEFFYPGCPTFLIHSTHQPFKLIPMSDDCHVDTHANVGRAGGYLFHFRDDLKIALLGGAAQT